MRKAPCLTADQSHRQRASHQLTQGAGMVIISCPLLQIKEEMA